MNNPKNYLITGATGFIGKNILEKLKKKKDINIYYLYRKKNLAINQPNLFGIKIDLSKSNDFKKLKNILKKIDIIIHCANLAHNHYSKKVIEDVNYKGTIKLAKLATLFNIKKFIFLSTAKINMNYDKKINNEDDISIYTKNDFYTYIKYKTEKKIISIFTRSKVNYIILRPALVYGKNVKGNLKRIKILSKIPLPLPFSNAIEKKSFCSINNLTIAIESIISKKIKNSIFLVSDDKFYSFKDLLFSVFKKANKKIILFPFNLVLFKFFLTLINKKNIYESIFSPMILDNSKIKKECKIILKYNLDNTYYL